MTTPDERKTLQVSPAVHKAVHDLGTRLGTSAEGALRHLLKPYTVRVQLEPAQYTRWSAAADALGVTLPTFAVQRVEESLKPSSERQTLEQIFYRVDLLCQAAGLKEPTIPDEEING